MNLNIDMTQVISLRPVEAEAESMFFKRISQTNHKTHSKIKPLDLGICLLKLCRKISQMQEFFLKIGHLKITLRKYRVVRISLRLRSSPLMT